jgi:leader peptidase (prepilin peptidase)/N-methyltransferase
LSDIPPINFFDPYYRPYHLALAFVLGACFGSFFNVCIYRIPLGVSLSKPDSHCYRCGRPVRWFDNIPLVSYWVLGGRCRQCGASFSIRYFLVELLTACLVTATVVHIGYSLALIPALIFTGLLIVGAFTDIDHWIIPDRVTLGGLAAGVVLAAVWPVGLAAGNPLAERVISLSPPLPVAATPLVNALAGAALGFGSLWLIGLLGSILFRKDAMGFGDVKLFAMFGAFCGAFYLVHILILACLVGTVVGLIGIVRGRLASRRPMSAAVALLKLEPEAANALMAAHPLGGGERALVEAALNSPGPVGAVRHHLPFGPSLAVAAWIVYLWGPYLSRWFVEWSMGDSVWMM